LKSNIELKIFLIQFDPKFQCQNQIFQIQSKVYGLNTNKKPKIRKITRTPLLPS